MPSVNSKRLLLYFYQVCFNNATPEVEENRCLRRRVLLQGKNRQLGAFEENQQAASLVC